MSFDRFYDEWNLEGTAWALLASAEGSTDGPYSYQIDLEGRVNRKSLRAYRLEKVAKGKMPPEIPEHALQDELAVLFGADMSAAQAVTALTLVIQRIKEYGLPIGRNRGNDDVIEKINGDLVVL